MFPTGFVGIEAQLWLWLLAMIRPGAAFLAAPVFGAPYVPVQLRLIVALAVGIPAAAAVPFAMPDGGLATIAGRDDGGGRGAGRPRDRLRRADRLFGGVARRARRSATRWGSALPA